MARGTFRIQIMLFYNTLTLLVIALSYFARSRSGIYLYLLAYVILLWFLGGRYQIGADWLNYLNMFLSFAEMSLAEAVLRTDALFGLVAWSINEIGGNFYVLNCILATIFLIGVYQLSKIRELSPAIFLAALMPYFVIVVAPNYLRQATALGFYCSALFYCNNSRFGISLALSLVSVLFHSSAIFGLALIFFVYWSKADNRKRVYLPIVFFLPLLLFFVLDTLFEKYEFYVVENNIVSSGAVLRSALYALPFFTYLIFVRRKLSDSNLRLIVDSGAVLYLVSIGIIYIDSVIGDRVALYTIPMQAIALSLFVSMSKPGASKLLASLFSLSYVFLSLNIWLIFSLWAKRAWLPYDNLLYCIVN